MLAKTDETATKRCVFKNIAVFLINFQRHFNFLFTEAFQCSETNGSNGIDETDLAVLTGILSNPAVTQKFKVSTTYLYLKASIFIY